MKEEPIENATPPRKSTLGSNQLYNEKILDWLRKQDDSAPKPEEIVLPTVNEGRENKPALFKPDPSRVQAKWKFINPSIWDEKIFPNNRDREGVRISVRGGKINNIDDLDLTQYNGFIVVLSGGDEIAVFDLIRNGSTTKTGRLLTQALAPYRAHPEFFETIEGPLLVTLYWLRHKGISVSEIRLITEADQ